jgi:lysozyme
MSFFTKVRDQLVRDEGIRLKPYEDSVGLITIGVGRNIEQNGISYDEAMFMLQNDVARCMKEAASFKWYTELTEDRQVAIVNMIFNLGMPRFQKFKGFIAAMSEHDYDRAAFEMMDSRWAVQVGDRAKRLANIIRGE